MDAYKVGELDDISDGCCSRNSDISKTAHKMSNQKRPERKKVVRTLSMNDFKKFKNIKNISSRYEFGSVLGEGAFGKVRKCVFKDTGREFAIKIVKKDLVKKRKVYVELLKNEFSILGSKSHPKIITIVDLLEDYDNYYIVSELVEGGELFHRLQRLESFEES